LKSPLKKCHKTRWVIGTGLFSALASTLCCIVPLLLFLLGIGGAWLANLSALGPYRIYFLILAIVSVGIGFWNVYKKPKPEDCPPGSYCAVPGSNTLNKIMLWIAMVVIGFVIAYPYVLPLVLDKF
jgi:mercuric ion transport protein